VAELPRVAFVLGAGLGTRLRPLTDRLPKPLLPIGGRPLVLAAMERLAAGGVRRFLVNTHHLPEAWGAAFPDGRMGAATVELVHEPELLETGGGLANIAGRLGEDETELLVWNGDILCDTDLRPLAAAHRRSGAEATLLLRPAGPNANVRADAEGRVTDLRDRLGSADRAFQFTGIAVVSRAFARATPAARESLVEEFLRRVRAAPGSIRGHVDGNGAWDDIGTPEAYAAAHLRAAESAAEEAGWRASADGAIAKGGSSRRFARAEGPGGARGILCLDDGLKAENRAYGALARLLRGRLGMNVPAVLADSPAGALVLEDLGTVDLLALTREPRYPWAVAEDALDQVARLHRDGLAAAAEAGLPLQPRFDEALYRWERDYFADHVLAGRRLDRGVADETASLARELLAQPAVAVHRDFQSQNILAREGRAWLIDFQGMRAGCAAYDFASLAFDPYVTRGDAQLWRIEIEDASREAAGWKGSRDEWGHLLHVAATQRLLQACGAYANLGLRQGKADFLAHLPQGLANLEQAALGCGRRRIAALARELREKPFSAPRR
jgi:aminoglycoside/choline kinase family phosphotransferase/choline kinase